LGREYGFGVSVIAPYLVDGYTVSSTLIRKHIMDGEVQAASHLLGRLFSLRGVVSDGARIGREIGIPTANIVPTGDLIMPKQGVYASSTRIGDRIYRSITNIGNNPTIGVLNSNRAETYIFDFDKEIYGREIEVFMHTKIRDEMKFNGIGKLRDGIRKDILEVRGFFG
jgi:riboflavin kinase/FMN adenylyltransferase